MEKLSQFFSFLIFFLPLLIVGSCGMPQSKTTLKISSSMAVTNNTYSGGLVFYGRSSGGKFFSIPVGYNVGANSNQAEIILDKGNWTFAAVGWKTDPDYMEGKSECAVAAVSINNDNHVVNLDLDSGNCSHSEFGSNFTGGSTNEFHLSQIITCGTFYTDTITDPSNLLVLSTHNPNFCTTNTNIPPDLKVWASSVQVVIPAYRPGQGAMAQSPLSFCLDLDQGKLQSPSKRLPAKGVPFIIELFNRPCAVNNDKESLGRYEMREGLNFNYNSFDHKFFNTSLATPGSNLYLLTGLSRKGTTSLLSSMPSFKCDIDNPCITIPKHPTNAPNYLYINQDNPLYLVDESGTRSCQKLNKIQKTGGSSDLSGNNAKNRCNSENGKLFIKLSLSDLVTTLGCSSTCTLEFTFDAPASPLSISRNISIDTTPSLQAYNFIFSIIGHKDILSFTPNDDLQNGINSLIFLKQQSERSHFGELSEVREFFSPSGIGGMLNQITSPTGFNNVNVNMAIWDKGILQSFNIRSEPDNMTVPKYLQQDDGYFGQTVDHSTFTHKITLSRILGGAYDPFIVLRWVHDGNSKKVGIMEVKDSDSSDGVTRTHRKITAWNTEHINFGRFETYSMHSEVLSSNPANKLKTQTRYVRAERNGTKDARLERYSFESEKNLILNNENQRASQEIAYFDDSDAYMTYASASAIKPSGGYELFERDQYNNFLNSPNLNPTGVAAISPNKIHAINAWAEETSSNSWNIKILTKNSTGVTHWFMSGIQSFEPPVIKVTINNGGEAAIAWVTQDTFTPFISYKLYAMAQTGSNWFIRGPSSTTTATITTSPSSPITTISIPGNFISNMYQIGFDLIDEGPTSSSSTKKMYYSDYPSSSHYIKETHFSSSSWSSPTTIYGANAGEISFAPEHMTVSLNSGDYYVSFIYQNSLNSTRYLKSFTLTGSTISGEDEDPLPSYFSSVEPKKVFSYFESGLQRVFVIASQAGDNIYKNSYDGSTVVAGTVPLGNQQLQEASPQNDYCFDRSMTSSNPMGDSNNPYNCEAPAFSYAPAIKSSVTVGGVDVGFKHDIKSLNPETFKYLFTIP